MEALIMKNFAKIFLIIFVISIFTLTLTSCNQEKEEKDKKAVTKATAKNKEAEKEPKKTEVTTNPELVNKKIIIVNEMPNPETAKSVKAMTEFYTKKGCKSENIKEIQMENNISDPSAVIGQVKEFNPDLIHLLAGVPGPVRFALAGLGIPIVVGSLGELEIGEKGFPKANVTGFKAISDSLPNSLCKLINNLAPIKGKKAVFICHADARMFTPEMIKKALKTVNVELKEFISMPTTDDLNEKALAMSKRISEDEEVGWVIVGILPVRSDANAETTSKKVIDNLNKKPIAAFYEDYVKLGALSGIGLDPEKGLGLEPAEMGLKILNGTPIKNIKIQDHKFTNISLSKYAADKINLKIPDNIFQSAYRIYTDPNGKFVGD